MASTRNPLQDLILTPQQQSLLFAALTANRPTTGQPNTAFNMSPLQYDGSPIQAGGIPSSFQNSPDLDYDYDFAGADSSFDFPYDGTNQPKMIGDLPGTNRQAKSDSADAEVPEKRSHPEDGEDSGAKRRESEEKVGKKPGRKPLTTEPTSKRKAQNRAAQRAFRERKEKHLRDLETKVQELEKLSQAANNENEALRAKVEQMTVELNEYKKRVSLLSGRPIQQGPAKPFGDLFVNNLNDVNFQFEFPKFGSLPGPPIQNAKKPSATQSQSPKQNGVNHRSPSEKSQDGISPGHSTGYGQTGQGFQNRQDFSSLSSGLYTPPLTTGRGTNGSTASADSHYNNAGPTTTSSPSASSNSNTGGPSSSCGTSPEPFTQSPVGFKPLDTLTTIGEEQPSLGNSAQDLGHFNSGMDEFGQWLPQTDFQFDPQLFGGYRDQNTLSTGFDDSFFNDALDVDFLTPYNLPITSPALPKNDLISQIDAAKEDDTAAHGGNLLMKCNEVWERIQKCPKAQTADFDLDALCADLQKKAKCDGTGPVISETDFEKAIKKHLCKDEQKAAEIEAEAKKIQAQAQQQQTMQS